MTRLGARGWWALVALALALYALLLFHPLVAHLWRGGPAAWIEGDVPEEYWPDLTVLCRGLAHGHLPRWSPWEHGGAPFSADPQAGVYYPLNWALCALSGPAPSAHWADARVVIHFWLGSLFMAAFLRGEGLGRPASLAGAVIFPLGPFLRHNWELNLTWGFAWLPLVLLLVRLVTRRPTPLRGAALGLGLALAALTGSPPALFYGLLLAIPFGIHAAFHAAKDGVPARAIALAVTAAGLTAAALSLPMLASARELAALSVRSHPDLAMIAEGSLAPRDLLGVLLPDLNDHTYVGLLVLALVPWALRRESRYAAAWPFTVTAVLGALLMLGDHTPLLRLACAVVPGAAQFRDPARYSALWGTSVLVLAAAGLDAVIQRPPGDPARRRWALAAGLVALSCVAAGVLPALDPLTHGKGLVRAGLVLALGVAAITAGRTAGRDARLAAFAVALLSCVDLFPYLPAERHTRPGPFPDGQATHEALLAVAGDDLGRFRTYDEFAIHMRSGSRFEQRDFRGYQDPLTLGRYQKVVGELSKAPLLLASFNVRWVLWGPHYLHGDGHHFLADPTRATWATLRAPHVYEIPTALPMAFWMDGVEIAADADAALARVEAAAPAPIVVLEASSGEAATPGSGAFVPAQVTRGEEAITVAVTAPAAGFVVLNEAWYPGWEARVDGEAAAIRRANSLVMAVRVPAGQHRVALTFRPWQPRVLEPIAGVVLAIVAVGLVLRVREQGRG
jgi:hypothetical protein